MCVQVHMCAYVHTYGGQKSSSGVPLQQLSTLCFETGPSPGTWGSVISLVCMGIFLSPHYGKADNKHQISNSFSEKVKGIGSQWTLLTSGSSLEELPRFENILGSSHLQALKRDASPRHWSNRCWTCRGSLLHRKNPCHCVLSASLALENRLKQETPSSPVWAVICFTGRGGELKRGFLSNFGHLIPLLC